MLTFIYGENGGRAREALEKEKEKFLKENPLGTIATVFGDDAAEDTLLALLQETELFSSTQMIILSDWCQGAEAKDFLLAELSKLDRSKKLFVIYERELDGRLSKKISAEAGMVFVCENKEAREEAFNIFSIANALGERDKKKLWLLLVRALEDGTAPEEIHGTLFWQVKAMSLAKDAESGREQNTGLSPFVLRNATRYAKNFTERELSQLAQELVDMYHRAHQGEIEFPHALERLALKI